MAMYEVPSGPRRLPVEHLPIDVPSATLTPELDVVVDGETVGSVEDAELAQLAAAGVRLPQYFVLMTPYAVTLAVMIWVASGKYSTGNQPGALGIPFIREERR